MTQPRFLGDLCSAIVDCAHKTAPIDESGAYFAVGTPAMKNHIIDFTAARRINEMTFKEWTTRLRPRLGDLLLAREAPVGPVVQIPAAENVAPGQRTVLLRPRNGVCDPRFLYYYLTSPATQAELLVKAAGSTVPHLNVADVRVLPTPNVPAIEVQRAIAEVLGALDDKIAANRRALDKADELVRARYDGLSGGTASLGSIATNIRVQVDPRSVAPDTTYVGLEHVPRRSMWLADFDEASKVTSAKSEFRSGDVLFGKLRPYFHKVVSAPCDGVASTDILVVRSKRHELAGLVLAAASSDAAVAAASASSEGTRMPRTKWADLAALEVTWPGEEEARRFSSSVTELGDWANAIVKESRDLAATRDELLPLLMSGRVRVKDGESAVEGVL